MKKLFVITGILFSITLTMCDSPSRTGYRLTKKQKVKFYYEEIYAQIKADSAADVLIPNKKELEDELDSNTPNIVEMRRKYLVVFEKWNEKKQEILATYNNEIEKKYNVPGKVFNEACAEFAQDDSRPAKQELVRLLNGN
jgi:hypothetical protein